MDPVSIQGLLYLIVFVLLLGLLLWAVSWVLSRTPIPGEARNIILVIIAVIFLIWLLGRMFGVI